MGKWLLLLLWAGCNSPRECSQLQACQAGGYQFCKSGDSCAYAASDGTVFPCDSCGSCQSAADQIGVWCSGMPHADMALSNMASGVMIPKSGPPYTGSHTDPGLTDPSQCPDVGVEPNDSPDNHPIAFTPTPNVQTPKITKMAICPSGDQDWYEIDNLNGSALYLSAELFYDITFGDLDVAIVDSSGKIVAYDGTSVSDGCTTVPISTGTYYVLVAGANNIDVNNYELLIRSWTAPHPCP